jgi:glutamate carboxypeptidase
VEISHQVLALAGLARPDVGSTVTPTTLTAGSSANTVPAAASLSVDVRAATEAEQRRIDTEIRKLRPRLPEAGLAVSGGINRPPLDPASSAGLFELAGSIWTELGQPPLVGVTVGGGSDGNFTAGIGVPTLDGLGAVGGHAHAEGEWVALGELPNRVRLVAELTRRLLESDGCEPAR